MNKNNLRAQRIGEENINYQGCVMRIVDYVNASNITIEFQDKHKAKIKCTYVNYKRGQVKNPFFPSVLGVGYIGNTPDKKSLKKNKIYICWSDMLERCYGKTKNFKNDTYRNRVTICEEWLCYSNFSNWIRSQENYQFLDGSCSWALDKDILIKNNTMYAPDKCCIVPSYINGLFIKEKGSRGKYPIGVSITKDNTFQVHCSNGKQQIYLGCYDTSEYAFEIYKEYKETIIKESAQKAFEKKQITKKCYDAMMKYKVEIID